MKKIFLVDLEKCTGCRLCQFICSFQKEGEFNFTKARIGIAMIGDWGAVPLICHQCDELACAEACPVEAINKDQSTGAVKIDKKECTLCQACVDACPYKAIFPHNEELLVCDLCDGEPSCVNYCAYGCLEFADLNEVNLSRKDDFSKRLFQVLKSWR